MTLDATILAGINQAAATTPDMNSASKGGGGEYVPPAAGPCQLRLIGYIESGLQAGEFDGKPKNSYEVQLIWELSGPNHQPKVLDDGTKLPHRMTMYLNASQMGYHAALNEKSALYKLFRRLNYDGSATHFAQLVGKGFLGTVIHKAGRDGKVRAYLKGPDGITVQPPRFVNPIDGTTVEVNVAPAISPLRVFLWNAQGDALKAMWTSLFIEGEYPASEDKPAKSKNVLQNRIKEALNFKDSPIFQYLQTNGYNLTLGDPVDPAPTKSADPLAEFEDDIPF